MKNPNHYGTITRLAGNRRKPWIVKEGLSGLKKPIGYCATKEEAIALLADYNRTLWDIEAAKLTFKDLYNLWIEKRSETLGKSNYYGLKMARNYTNLLNNLKYKDIKAYHMQECINLAKKEGKGAGTQAFIASLFVHLDKFARELDIIQNCNSELLTVHNYRQKQKRIFTSEEVAKIWQKSSKEPFLLTILLLLYSGWRITELLTLKCDHIDLAAGVMQGGIKTAAGKNRIVPIHQRIEPIVRLFYNHSATGYLIEHKSKPLYYTAYHRQWTATMTDLAMDHTIHETRHTFRSWLDSANANVVCIDRIMGHASKGIGANVYTHKSVEELRETIALIA